MSIVFFPEAVERVLHSELGMVGVFVRRKAEPIRDKIVGGAVGGNGRGYYESSPTLGEKLASDVSLHMDGSTAVIAINPGETGNKWRRLFAKNRDASWQRRPDIILQESHF